MRFSTTFGASRSPDRMSPMLASNCWTPPMPTRFIHSRSRVIPSRVTLPFIQCHHTRGRAASGGSLKPWARESSAARTTAGGGQSVWPSSATSPISATKRVVRSPVLFIPRPPSCRPSLCGRIGRTVLAGADVHGHDRPVLFGCPEPVARGEGFAPLGHGGQLRSGQPHRRPGVGRDLHGQLERSVLERPGGAHLAVRRLVAGRNARETPAWSRLDEDVLVTGSAFVDLDAGHDPVHPPADGPVGVVVERVHPRVRERAAGLLTVPRL